MKVVEKLIQSKALKFIIAITAVLVLLIGFVVIKKENENVGKISGLEKKIEEVVKEKEELSKLIKKADRPDVEYEKKAREIAKSALSGWGAKTLIVLCLVLSAIFFFRFRNYGMAIVFYLIAYFLTFFGHNLAKWLFK